MNEHTHYLRGIGELVSLIPLQLGFVPGASVVVLFMDDARFCGLVRVDEASCVREPEVFVDSVVHGIRGAGCDEAAIIGWGLQDADVLQQACHLAEQADVRVTHLLAAEGDEYWSLECTPGCCDGARHRMPGPETSSLATSLVLRSGPPIASRDEAEAAFVRTNLGSQHKVLCRLESDEAATWSSGLAAWFRLLDDDTSECSDQHLDDLATLLSSIETVTNRDALIWRVVPELAPDPDAVTGPEHAQRGHISSRLQRFLPAIPDAWGPVWLCLLAMAYWRDGDNVRAGFAAHRARKLRPDMTLADLVVHLAGTPFAKVMNSPAMRDSDMWTA